MKEINYVSVSVRILVILILLFIVTAIGRKQYTKGYNAGIEAIQKKQQAEAARQQAALNKASANYEKQKEVSEVKQNERQTQVTKIVRVPVYTNVCLDASGVHVINEAISSR